MVNPSLINADRTLPNDKKQHFRKTCVNQQPLVSSLILSSEIQVHRQVPLKDAKISETTKLAQHDLLQKFDSIISKKKKQ